MTLLTSRAVPELQLPQLSLFTQNALRAIPAFAFNPHTFLLGLNEKEGQKVYGIELGGDKLTSQLYEVKNSTLSPIGDIQIFYSTHGRGYLEKLEEISEKVRLNNFPIGISFAGPIDQGKIVAAPNMQTFFSELKDSPCQGDFQKMFPLPITIINDAVATTLTASVEMARKISSFTSLLLIIIGSGLGGALWKESDTQNPMIIACEPGHIPVIPELNPYHQQHPCPLLENSTVCIEHIAAGKAGIESIYEAQKHTHLTGEEISKKYQTGDALSSALYENSAEIVVHTIQGMITAFSLPLDSTLIALHGGVTLVPEYSDRIRQIVKERISSSLPILETKEITSHSGIMGAATAALTG